MLKAPESHGRDSIIIFREFAGRWYVKVKPTPTGEPQEVKIKVRINANGVIQITGVNIVDKKAKEEVPVAVDNGNSDTNNMEVGQEVRIAVFSYFLLVLCCFGFG